MFKQRILIQLSVKGDIRFVSHHDLMRALGRSARRAGLPVAMSEGFNPRDKISLLLARGVGVASTSEYAEIDLSDWVSVDQVARRLNEKLPDGLCVERAELGNPRRRRRVVGIDYRVECRDTLDVTQQRADEILGTGELWVKRERKKSGRTNGVRRVDIRPFIGGMRVDGRCVVISLIVTERGTTRPEEVFKVLGLEPEKLLADCTVTRTAMTLAPEN